MPKRGSVRFLLLSLRRRATLGTGIGATIIVFLAARLITLQEGDPLLEKTGLAQALRQSAWEQALAGRSQPERWPWQDVSANMSLAPAAKVPRLGLSAALLSRPDDAEQSVTPTHQEAGSPKGDETPDVVGDVVISDVVIGDSITFTAADGATCIYTITGRRVVDPHLAAREAERSDGELLSCSPLDRLILQATQEAQHERPVVTETADDQQKL